MFLQKNMIFPRLYESANFPCTYTGYIILYTFMRNSTKQFLCSAALDIQYLDITSYIIRYLQKDTSRFNC